MSGSGRKRIAIILNGLSLRKNLFYKKFLPVIRQDHTVDVFETLSRNDGIHLSRKAAEQYTYDVILAAGGDGTLHQVVNGVLQGRESDPKTPVIGIIPLGSGNDFAKTAGIKPDASQFLKLLMDFKPKQIDVGEIIYKDFSGKKAQRYFVNVADIGMGPEVVKRVVESTRVFGSEIAYYKSIISTFLNYTPMIVHATAFEWTWSGKCRSLAVANGKFYGHGMCIAPDALPDDRLFTVFICGNVSVLDFIWHSATLKRSGYIRIPEVKYLHSTAVELASENRCLIEGDGEVLGELPATIRLIKRRIPMLI
jgi:diacylglycerol kinase (ATP)